MTTDKDVPIVVTKGDLPMVEKILEDLKSIVGPLGAQWEREEWSRGQEGFIKVKMILKYNL